MRKVSRKIQNKGENRLQGFQLLSMVKIKYNNMKMSIKTTPNQSETRKRTLRSSLKASPQENIITGSSSEEKVIEDIHKQFENQQSINASKSTDPFHQEVKPNLQPQAQKQSPILTAQKADFAVFKSQSYDFNVPSQKQVQVHQLQPISSFSQVPQPRQVFPNQSLGLFETPLKSQSRNSKNEHNYQFKESRKSYRKSKRSSITQIPYRKFQDQFEQKIVILMNKVFHQKSSQKEIENFIEKIQKISSKELYNPYVISGIQTVLTLLEKSSPNQIGCLAKFKAQVKNLYTKIWTELEKTSAYEDAQIQQKQVNFDLYKPRFIKKLYKILLETKKYDFNQAREKSYFICESFFAQSSNLTNEDDLLSFFKDQKFLEC